MTSASDGKWRTFSYFFSVQGTGGIPTGSDPEVGWVIKALVAKVGQFFLGCMCPVIRGIVVQEQDTLGDLTAAFSFKEPSN
jgi:hypothetical protein